MHDLPLKVASLMRDFRPPWFVAGGWAIDLYVGRVTRPHDDIEIGVFRPDQSALQRHLEAWELRKAVGGELRLWRRGEFLEPSVHEIHCFKESAEPSRLEVLLNERDGSEWVYRRDGRIRRSLDRCLPEAGAGLKYLCPEAALLYKSKSPREKDERDFAAAAPLLDAEQRAWLKGALAVCDPRHRWVKSL